MCPERKLESRPCVGMRCHAADCHATFLPQGHQLCLSAPTSGDAVRLPAASSGVGLFPGKNRHLYVLVDWHLYFILHNVLHSHVCFLHLPHAVQQALQFHDPFVSFHNLGLSDPEASLRFFQSPDVLVELGLGGGGGESSVFDILSCCGPSKYQASTCAASQADDVVKPRQDIQCFKRPCEECRPAASLSPPCVSAAPPPV